MVSRQLQDSANRLFGKAATFIENGEYDRALESLKDVDKIMKKEKDSEISFHTLFLKGYAISKARDPEGALEFYGEALKIIEPLFSGEPGKKDYQKFISNTIEEIGISFDELNDDERAKELLGPMKQQLEKIVRTFEELVKSDPENQEYLSSLLEIIGSMGLCYQTGQLMDETVKLFDKKIDIYEKLFELESGETDLLGDFDEDIELYGYLFRNYGHLKEAEGNYLRAAGIYRKMIERDPENSMAEYYLSYTYSYLGNLYSGMENLEKAERYYEEAVELMDKGYKEFPEDYAYAVSLAKIHEGYGVSFSNRENLEKSIANYTKAREIYRDLIINHPSEFASNKKIAMYLDELGDRFLKIGEFEAAELCYKDKLEVYQNLHDEDPEDLNPIMCISDTYDDLGELFAEEGETEKARSYYEKELEIYESLLEKEPDALDFKTYKAEIQANIGMLYLDEDPEKAQKYLEDSLSVLENNFELEPDEEIHYSGLKTVINNLITLFKNRKEHEKAVEIYSKLLAAQQRMLDLNPKDREYQKELAATYTSLALLYSEIGDVKQESHYHRLSLDILEKLFEESSDDLELLQRFIAGLYILGSILKLGAGARGNESRIVKEYIELAQKAESKLQALKPGTIGDQELIAEIAEKMGISFRENEMYEEAIEEFKRSLAIREKLHEKNPENLNYLTVLEGTFHQLGITFLAQTDLEKAKEALEKAMNLNARLLETDPEDFNYLARSSMIFETYSSVLKNMGKSEEAAKYLAKAEEINAKLGYSNA